MSDASDLLTAAELGDPEAASQLLPLVYDQLRRLAAARLARESPGQTLDPTALVHEAYLRLVGTGSDRPWQNRRHFVAAAAEAMRFVLVDRARRKGRVRHGGKRTRLHLDEASLPDDVEDDRLLDVSDAIDTLAASEPEVAQMVKLRFFAGLTVDQAAEALGISVRTAHRHWAFARAWLYDELQ